MATYTYDPAEIPVESVSRARFELGDIAVAGGAESCYLCDEEITVVISDGTISWKRRLQRLAEAVYMRLSYEVNWKNDGTAFDLSQRADRWAKLCEKLKHDADIEASLPVSNAVTESVFSSDGGHYFHRGMQKSPYVQPPYPIYREGDP